MSRASFIPAADATIVSGDLTQSFIGHFRRTAAQNCAADADGILDGTELTDDAQTITTFLEQPTCAKNITVKGTAANMAGTVTVNGRDINGNDISEDFTLSGTSSLTGNKAFASVSSIILPAKTTAGDTVDVGWGVKLGLPVCLAQNTVIKALRDTSTADTGTVAVSESAVESNTYAAGATAKSLDIWLLIN